MFGKGRMLPSLRIEASDRRRSSVMGVFVGLPDLSSTPIKSTPTSPVPGRSFENAQIAASM